MLGKKSLERERASLKFLLFMPSVCQADTRWQFLHKSRKVSDGKNSIMKPGEQPQGLAGAMSDPSSFVCSSNQTALCLALLTHCEPTIDFPHGCHQRWLSRLQFNSCAVKTHGIMAFYWSRLRRRGAWPELREVISNGNPNGFISERPRCKHAGEVLFNIIFRSDKARWSRSSVRLVTAIC